MTLIITTDDGERETLTRLVVATGAPTASLSAPESADAGAEITLDASESSDDHGIDSYAWDLTGDGTVDETTTDPTIVATLEETGTHEVSVTAVDAAGQEDTATASIDVETGDGTEQTNERSLGTMVGVTVSLLVALLGLVAVVIHYRD
jgi:PKD repeat protein